MKHLLKKEWLLLLVLAVPVVFLLYVWPLIPDRVPVHFNANFKPDHWMPKLQGTLLLPVANVFTVILCMVLYHYDPRLAKSAPETRLHVRSVVLTVLITVSSLLGACTFAIVWAAWGNLEVISQVMRVGLPLLLIVVGNCLGKLRPNYSIGIRVPWTLESDVVWTRTHRFSGRLLVGLAVTLLAGVLLGIQPTWFVVLLISVVIAWSAVTIFYAMVLSRREQRGAV